MKGGPLAVSLLLLAPVAQAALAQPAGDRNLTELSLDELSKLNVTSVSRRDERLADAPASIFVITAEDIRRSGATSLPEALRLAPNLQVARFDAAQYAISARGFNNVIANKLLVLVLIEDVERIEVISGPGATLWGANAVNGVINVITRAAGQTQGVLASLGGGNRCPLRLASAGEPGALRHGAERPR